jgi:hypothetical protein
MSTITPPPHLLTHRLEFKQPDGRWKPGFLAYTLQEAHALAAKRRNDQVRVVKIEPRDD